MSADRSARADTGASTALTDALTRVVLDALEPPHGVRDAYASIVRGALADVDPSRAPDDLTRALRRVLRRVEVLRGPDARERVARELADITGFARREPSQHTVVVRGADDAERLAATLVDAAADVHVRPETLRVFAHAVRDIVREEVVVEDDARGGVTVRLDVYANEVSAAWFAPRAVRHVTASLREDPAGS